MLVEMYSVVSKHQDCRSKEISMGRARSMHGTYRIVHGKSEGKRSLTILRFIWEDNIKVVVKEVGWL